MTEPDTTPRRGRRARALSPEESAALESRTAAAITGEQAPVPGVRGAVAPPGPDSPVPTLRKFGRRARIIELSDDPEATAVLGPVPDEPQSADAMEHDSDPAADDDATTSASAGTDRSGVEALTGAATPEGSSGHAETAVIDRDHDGVELGEVPVTEAPSPRPAPRFDGKVLHRPETSASRPLVWAVWALIAIALIVLVALLLTGVLGPTEASALGASTPELLDIHDALEVAAA